MVSRYWPILSHLIVQCRLGWDAYTYISFQIIYRYYIPNPISAKFRLLPPHCCVASLPHLHHHHHPANGLTQNNNVVVAFHVGLVCYAARSFRLLPPSPNYILMQIYHYSTHRCLFFSLELKYRALSFHSFF